MRRLGATGLGMLAVVLAACDDATVITHVGTRGGVERSDLVAMQDASGIPVEIHGMPWKDADRSGLAAAMRPPAGASQGVRFHALDPGGHAGRHGWRLVLHFNPQGSVPRSDQDCQLSREIPTAGPQADGFSVNATFCRGPEWQAHGYLRVPKAVPGDRAAFADAMAQLFLAIFRENSDPDR